MLLALVLAAGVAHSTWCWTPDLKHGDCIYNRERCHELAKLRRAGVCISVDRWREMRK